MIKEALQYLIGLAPATQFKIDGVLYTDKPVSLLHRPRAAPLEFATLQGFVDFINHDADGLLSGEEAFFIHVHDPWHVFFYASIDPLYKSRDCHASAIYDPQRIFPWANRLDQESFLIAVQTLFSETPDRARLLAAVGNMTGESLQNLSDDGITQSVSRRVGVQLSKLQSIENPYQLAPHRTFAEVEQPPSPFILRVFKGRDGEPPSCALFEADNGAWKLAAINAIRDWVKKALTVDVAILA